MENRKSFAASAARASLPDYPPVLQAIDLDVHYKGSQVIHGVSITLHPGELRFLVGPDGAGKTTLLHSLCGKVAPARGQVLLHGAKVDFSKHQELKIAGLGTGRKSQAPSAFVNLTVLENLLLSMKQKRGLYSVLMAKADRNQLENMRYYLQLIDLQDKAGEKAGALASGERLRLEIGMLLMQEPDVLLLDEPTNGLSPEEKNKLGQLLLDIGSTQSMIIADRDPDFVRRFASTITVLHEGRIVKEGTVAELQAGDEWRRCF